VTVRIAVPIFDLIFHTFSIRDCCRKVKLEVPQRHLLYR
jgi:hypothetical protein